MKANTLYIKNMVCDRCIKAVRHILETRGATVETVELGEVRLAQPFQGDMNALALALENEGFQLIDTRESRLINAIKSFVIKHIHHAEKEESSKKPFSSLLEQKIGRDYAYLSQLFSSIEGRTIESYVIDQRIERAKELLKYGELTVSEIAWKLNYSSVQHLSKQFKQKTGLTPSQFRSMVDGGRTSLDKI